ncbi:DNA repair protein RadA [bacterium]|jgi:hypothetical protein|nr:DNA repair protein RadA [bacterium]
MKTSQYITPITKIHSTLDDVKKFFEELGGISIFDDEKILSIDTLVQAKRNLIVGEPGVGKSLLLEKMNEYLCSNKESATLIKLRESDVLEQINKFLTIKSKKPRFLLLDGLDEVKSNLFPEILKKIEDISNNYQNVSLYISGRWVFISKHTKSFSEFRYITISPFTRRQVNDYLIVSGRSEKDVNVLLTRIMSFGHKMLIIQIPRYLSYFDAFLEEKGINDALNVSRNDLFEYFIYKKLALEDKKTNKDQKSIIKRVLEKLALTMEIYQTNVITKDELMTFFDDLKSDLKLAALSHIDMDVFYDCSLLKVSCGNSDKIEFENTEFQEYLAAKEITRFTEPNRATFAFTVDQNIKEVYPSWFNTLTFLVDMYPGLLEPLIEFSEIRKRKFKIIDENFFYFLSRLDPKNISKELRISLFEDIVEYHCRTYQWISGQTARMLSGLYDIFLEERLKKITEEAEIQTDFHRYVPLANITYIIAYLLQNKISIDVPYWKGKIIKYAIDKDEIGVLQRHALQALGELNDTSIIDKLNNFTSSDELISQAFLSMCISLDPDNPQTLKHVFDAISQNNFHGRYGLYEMKKKESIKLFLNKFKDDEKFRKEFLDDVSIFNDKDKILVERIKSFIDEDIAELCKQALIKSMDYNLTHNIEQSVFLCSIWELLQKREKENFVIEMLKRIINEEEGKTNLFYAHSFLARIVQVRDVQPCLQVMIDAGEKISAFNLMLRIKFSKRIDALEVYEAGRLILPNEYKKWEKSQNKKTEAPQNRNLLGEFRLLLEPEKGKFSNNVFNFYNSNVQQLEPLLSENDKKRIKELLSGTIFKFYDPENQNLKITNEIEGSKSYTTSSIISIFGDAIETAQKIGFDITPYRQKIINFIPFAYSEKLTIIFELVKNITNNEMSGVFEVYKNHKSDLWKHLPISFIETVKQYNLVEAAPILKALILNQEIEKYARQEALSVLNLIIKDSVFLKEVFIKYKDNENNEERKIAYIANGLLITDYTDDDSIKWRLDQLVKKAAAFIEKRGTHSVDDLEEEISYSKTFAKPLMNLKSLGYESNYLKLLEDAMEIWSRGVEFHKYSTYLWDVVYAYFDNLKEHLSYDPLEALEKAIAGMKNRDGANWLAGRMIHLRRSYLDYIGKPRNIGEAVAKYNDAREYNDKKIRNSNDLFRHIYDAADTGIRQFIDGEGAYKLIMEKKTPGQHREYEKLIQKTIKTQIENVMFKRGFQVEINRESQLLSDKRTDMLVHYGFTGPIVIEIKLTSNTDMKVSKIEKSKSFLSMKEYMEGYGASHGIFLVINNTNSKKIEKIKDSFGKIRNVSVISIDCYKTSTNKKKIKAKKSTGKSKK